MELDADRLRGLLDRFQSVTVAVLGDFFLDKYLVIDASLGETSLETGLEAHQVIEVRHSPGAAGTVTSNLRSLGVEVIALGMIGDDGNGLELVRELAAAGVDTSQIIRQREHMTPTYIKPMVRSRDRTERETNRLDIRGRRPLSPAVEAEIIGRMSALVPYIDGVVVVDQVEENNCGIVTDRVRGALIALSEEHPDKVLAAESRSRIGLFRKIILKPNVREAFGAVGLSQEDHSDSACAQQLFRVAEAPVYMTQGAEGILLCDEQGVSRIETVRVAGPIDVVGAGDSALAGIAASLCAGATRSEAALVGNLAASVTIRQIGTTGRAKPGQVVEAFGEFSAQSQSLSRSAQSFSVQSSNDASARPPA